MAGQVVTRTSLDPLAKDEYASPRPTKKKKKKRAKGTKGRDFRGIKNGRKDPGPGRIARAIAAPHQPF